MATTGGRVAGSRATVIVASFALRRDALAALLANAGYEVVVRERDLGRALTDLRASSQRPDLLVTDIRTWKPQDVAALDQIRDYSNRTKFVVLADRLKPDLADELRSAGVEGFLTPDIQEEALLRYLELVLMGERLFHPGIKGGAQESEPQPSTDVSVAHLSAREREVLMHVSSGLSNKLIARKLEIAPGTVKAHIRNLCRKLRQKNRIQLATWALVYEAQNARLHKAGDRPSH